MSYIRPLSNPEGLYIWHDVSGPVEAWSQGQVIKLPVKVFHKILLKWLAVRENVSFRGASMLLEEDYRWTFSYKDSDTITAWEVTWAYVAQGIYTRTELVKKKSKKIKMKVKD